jgi:hypothetical protein
MENEGKATAAALFRVLKNAKLSEELVLMGRIIYD